MSCENQPFSVNVVAAYIEESSHGQQFAFGYTVTIENHSDQASRLLNRHWVITDANDSVQEIRGAGVIGKQPRILPGETYTYSSHAILPTETGTMEGSYEMETDSGERFSIPIPLFSLTCPHALH